MLNLILKHMVTEIHIHDLDFFNYNNDICQIDLTKLFTDGFQPVMVQFRTQDIKTYAALACIAIQSNQNDQQGVKVLQNLIMI